MHAADQIVSAVQDLAGEIAAAQPSFDSARQLPTELVERMQEIGLFALWLPRELGGPALGLTDVARVIEAVAKLDGAVAWCAAIATTYSRLGAFLPRSTARKIFVDERAIIGGSFYGAAAEIAPGGYRLTGRMPYSSGIRHCSWAIGGGPIFENGQPRMLDDGQQESRTMLYPVSGIEIVDTWDVGGLRGTGSHDHTVDNLFVPEEQTVLFHGQATDCEGGLYRIPAFTTYPVPIAAVSLGIARTGLDLFYRLADTKIPRSGTSVLKEDPSVQLMIGRAEAALRSARSFLLEMTGELDETSLSGRPVTIRQRMMLRLACANVADSAKTAIQIVHEAAGGSAIYQRFGIERCFRDIHAAVQHVQVQNVNFRWASREFMGLPPSTARF